jgi:DivIVA domain-containing protein
VDIDRQAIERRDFPIARRGYDTAAVDAHLRALAAEIEELSRAAPGEAEPTLASTASTQVQSILQAAETAAAEIERNAVQGARDAREQADRDAEATRDQAIAQARAHVSAVSQATSKLLERVSSMDGEVGSMVESLRASASMLAGDLAAVDRNMGELYDAASKSAASERELPPAQTPEPPVETRAPAPPIPSAAPIIEDEEPEGAIGVPTNGDYEAAGVTVESSGDLDGARLIALNMALNGDSRADTDRYLAENFELEDRETLIDEVYAAIEG